VLVVVVTIYLLLVFPLFLNFNGYYCSGNKIFFYFELFGFIKILSGYAQVYKDGIGIHLTDKKALFIPFSNFLGLGKSIKPLKDYHLIKASIYFDLPGEKDLVTTVVLSFLIDFIANFISFNLKNVKQYVKTKTNTIINQHRELFALSLNFTVVFNIFMIVLSLIKMLMEKIYYETRKRKQNKFSS
jgi:hypothetical protein